MSVGRARADTRRGRSGAPPPAAPRSFPPCCGGPSARTEAERVGGRRAGSDGPVAGRVGGGWVGWVGGGVQDGCTPEACRSPPPCLRASGCGRRGVKIRAREWRLRVRGKRGGRRGSRARHALELVDLRPELVRRVREARRRRLRRLQPLLEGDGRARVLRGGPLRDGRWDCRVVRRGQSLVARALPAASTEEIESFASPKKQFSGEARRPKLSAKGRGRSPGRASSCKTALRAAARSFFRLATTASLPSRRSLRKRWGWPGP